MPYGVTWGFYLKTVGSSLFAMACGAQLVHLWYSPDISIPEVPYEKGALHTELYTKNYFSFKRQNQNGSNHEKTENS